MEAFAEKLGISKGTLQQLESATGNPTLKTLEHIAQQLKVSPAMLLSLPKTEQVICDRVLQISQIFTSLSVEKQLLAADLLYQLLLLFYQEEVEKYNYPQ